MPIRRLPTAVVGVAAALMLVGCRDDADASAESSAAARPRAWTIAAQIRVGRQPADFPVVAFGSLWVPNAGSGTVSRIDLGTSRVVATVRTGRTRGAPLSAEFVSPFALAAGGGAIWATRDVNDRFGVVKIDPRTNRAVATFRLPGWPYAVAYGHGSVWVTLRNANVLLRLHPRSGRILARIAVRGGVGVVATDTQVWVASSRDSNAQLVDPARNRVIARLPVGADVETLALCGGTLWAASGGGSVTQIDAVALRVVGQIAIAADPWTVDCEGDVVVAGAYASRSVFQIDSQTRSVAETVDMPSEINGVRLGSGSIWATSAPRNLTYRLDR